MKINILDAGLNSRAGHHFDFDCKLFKHLVEAGHDAHVYGYREFDDDGAFEELNRHGPVTKLFRRFQYHGPTQYDRYAGELDLVQLESAILAEDLRAVRDADVWIWPSIRVQHLSACALRGATVPIVGCVHEDPGIEARSIGALLWRAAFLSARRRKLRFTLGSVEPELRHRFAPIIPGGRFAIYPHPFDGPPIAEPKTALKRIGFFGHQREEKGAELIASLLDRLVQDGYQVTCHNSIPNEAGPDHPQVERLGYVDDLAVPIAACDLVVLPYDIDQYKNKGSGILAQCLALGIPVVGPVGTLPGRTIDQYNVGPLFGATNPESIHAAIKAADRHFASYAASAFRVAGEFSQRHGVARFAAALLACAR